jgi:serine/threonine protein kinase
VEPDASPQQLGDGQLVAERYRVEALIGRGGMAEVYRAFDECLARPVALKVLRAHYAFDPALRSRFEEEAKAAAMVSHPDVVAVYDAGEDGDKAFIVMELVSGETLADRIARGPLDEAATRQIGGEVLDALAAAHARGVLHRDIKPANVLLSDEGTAKVADFGIAKAIHPSPDSVQHTTEMVLGTPGYLAPERAEGQPATVRSDLWAVGVLLYEALSGKRPFDGDNAIAVTLAAREGRYDRLADIRPGTDAGLVSVIEKALEPDPADRFTTAAEMARSLRNPTVSPTIALDPGTLRATSPTDTQPLAPILVAAGAAGGAGAAGLAGAGLAGAGLAGVGLAGGTLADSALAGAPPAGGARAGGSGRRGRPGSGGSKRRHNWTAVLAAAAVVLLAGGILGLALAERGHHDPLAGSRHARRPPTSRTRLAASTTTTTTTSAAPSTTAPNPPPSTTPPSTAPPVTTPPTTAPTTTTTTTTTTATTTTTSLPAPPTTTTSTVPSDATTTTTTSPGRSAGPGRR